MQENWINEKPNYFQAVTILATVATFASAYPGGHGILIGGGGYGGYGKFYQFSEK